MRIFLKNSLLIIASLSAISGFSCSDYPSNDAFRSTNFDANFLNYQVLSKFIYDLQIYNGGFQKENYRFDQNIEQWYNYCNKKVSKKDIYNTLYHHLDSNALKSNSFHIYLQKNKEASQYLSYLIGTNKNRYTDPKESKQDFEKQWNNFSDVEFNYNYYSEYEQKRTDPELCLPRVLGHINSCKDSFIRQRYAYQALVDAFYMEDSAQVNALFSKYFNTKNKTWLENSAQHYYALRGNHQQRNKLLLNCIINGFDKMARNIVLLNDDKKFNQSFANQLNDTTRSYYYFVKSVRNSGRSLSDLQELYKLNPNNKYLNFLINRELNKIEQWLGEEDLIVFDPKGNKTITTEMKQLLFNLDNDKKYAQKFLSFLETIQRNSKNSLFLDISKTYISYLLNKPTIDFNPENYKKEQNQYVQARIINLFLNFDKRVKDGGYQNELVYILENAHLINKREEEYRWWSDEKEPVYMKEQLARTFAKKLMEYPQKRGEAFLLSGSSELIQESYSYHSNLYHDIFYYANHTDIDLIMSEIRNKNKSSFEKIICTNESNYSYHYVFGYNGHKNLEEISTNYDTLKILDIKAMKYVQKDELESALKIYNTFPAWYWDKYFFDNPFLLDIGHTNNYDKADKTAYTKKEFLEQFIAYKNQLKKEPTNDLLNYYLANAYFSLTVNGKNWYMTQLGYSNSEIEDKQSEVMNFSQDIYENKALPLYKNVLKNTKNNNLRAITLMVLAHQSENELKNLPNTDKEILKTVYGNCDLYEQYLSVFQTNYKPTISMPDRKKTLVGFMNFDVI
jgi:hypothetical protein